VAGTGDRVFDVKRVVRAGRPDITKSVGWFVSRDIQRT
jgi:hypothetical protein